MKRKSKFAIGALIIALICLIGLAIWSLKRGKKMSRITSSGETREIRVPNIPGMKLISEKKKDECSEELVYIYKLYKDKDLSSHLEQPIKNAFLSQGWQLEKETIKNGFKVFRFSSQKSGDLEKMLIKIGFESEQGTKLFLDYLWPPCSSQTYE